MEDEHVNLNPSSISIQILCEKRDKNFIFITSFSDLTLRAGRHVTLTTVQQRGQNHHIRAKANRRKSTKNTMATTVPSD